MAFEDLKNKIVLVTGASRGLGREIALEFSKHEAKVAVNYNSSPEKAKELKLISDNIEIFKADISNRLEVRNMVKEVEATLGKIDILVNNAGIWYLRKFEDFNEDEFNAMWRVNLMGTIYTTLEVIPHMKEKKRGSIINMASNAGIGTAAQGTTLYALTKAAIIMLTKRLAFELGPYGIRVNAIAPGWVETDLTIGGKTPDEVHRLEENFKSRTSLGMIGKPEHISKLAVYLGSDESSYMTGQVIVIDGGRIDNLTHSV
ncbi:MAG: glucose 1-dehydrogenase [Thermocladium sp.]